jgi:hypothetical protein
MRRNRTAGAGSRKSKAGGVTPAGFLSTPNPYCRGSHVAGSFQMANALGQDVQSLKEWLRGAWRRLADPNLTRIEQRELRYYMRDVERALRAGLKQIAARDMETRNAWHETASKRVDFRLLKVDA